MTLTQQLWGTTNEKIHTVGTLFLGLSAVFALVLGLKVKANGLLTFGCFALGVNLIGIAMLRNAWGRIRHGEDTLILLKKRDDEGRTCSASVHVFGLRFAWTGRVAHVDPGRFEVRPAVLDDKVEGGPLPSRCYQLFRACYWWACSTAAFQTLFGVGAIAYSLWLARFLATYKDSTLT